VLLIALGVFLAVVLLSRYVSMGSVCAALSVPLSMFLLHYSIKYLIFGAFVCLFAVLKHVPNIKRLLAGTETKISFKKG
jgi:glycerol-3-phosphate acyltransferase PlsY